MTCEIALCPVNFLLHRHLARRDLGDAGAAVGAMLPDVWRMSDRRVRAREDAPGEGPVFAGIRHHLEVDAWFHESQVFRAGERSLWGALATACPRSRRMAPLAHLTWELLLDGALVRREGSAFLDDLRRDLASVEPGELARSAEAHHFGRIKRTDAERATFETRVERILQEMARGPWILGYASAEGLLVSLSGVRARLGLEAIAASDLPALLEVLEAFAARADEALATSWR